MAMTLDREAELARRVRAQLGEFNDDNKAVETLVRELAEQRRAHLTQPAQAVDVDSLYEVIRGFGYTTRDQSDELAEAVFKHISTPPTDGEE